MSRKEDEELIDAAVQKEPEGFVRLEDDKGAAIYDLQQDLASGRISVQKLGSDGWKSDLDEVKDSDLQLISDLLRKAGFQPLEENPFLQDDGNQDPKSGPDDLESYPFLRDDERDLDDNPFLKSERLTRKFKTRNKRGRFLWDF